MGEPEPLDLELLKNGNEAEIDRAIAELGLFAVAQKTANRIMHPWGTERCREVALESISLLFTGGIRSCRTVDGIVPTLRQITRRRAINFLNVAYRRHETEQLDELKLVAVQDAGPYDFVRDVLAEALGMEEFDLAAVLTELVELCQLDPLEEALLVKYLPGELSQQEFADLYSIPIGSIGGRKERLGGRLNIS